MEPQPAELEYPESDGKPMSDNTLQAFWIILIFNNLNARIPDFVAANLLWYPVKGSRKALAPDVLVALGRPKGHRGSYLSWKEGDVQPQVVFEIRSPSNTNAEMREKRADYERFGVEEYYHYDPQHDRLEVFVRQDGKLRLLPVVGSFDSPLLGIRFLVKPEGLQIVDGHGQPFLEFEEERARREAAEAQAKAAEEAAKAAEEAAQTANAERAAMAARMLEEQARATVERAERHAAEELAFTAQLQAAAEKAKAAAEKERADRLLARLRALGLEEE